MKGCLKIIFCLSVVVATVASGLPFAFSQEEEILSEEVMPKEISGEIVSVDLENSNLVIRQLKDEVAQIYEDITIYVDNSTTIEKAYVAVTLSELVTGEKAIIEYTTSEEGTNVASFIGVETEVYQE